MHLGKAMVDLFDLESTWLLNLVVLGKNAHRIFVPSILFRSLDLVELPTFSTFLFE